jgi:hypothetical protein
MLRLTNYYYTQPKKKERETWMTELPPEFQLPSGFVCFYY